MSQGIEAPIDVQPWLLEKEGMCTNHGQIIPYISKDLQDHQQIYGTIARVYADLFEWVRQMVCTSILGTCASRALHCLSQMETYLQEEFELLMEVASVLPSNCSSPVAPFISLVVNVNVRTKAHRDSLD